MVSVYTSLTDPQISCAQTAGKVIIPDPWYTDVLAVTTVTVNGLQAAKEQMDK